MGSGVLGHKSPIQLHKQHRSAPAFRLRAGIYGFRCPRPLAIYARMLSRTLPADFIPPCLPMKAPSPPSGALWLHEIKHDGFRVIARKDGSRVRLYSRPGNDLTDRFSLIVEALAGLRSRSCIIDGEAVACDERGIAAFDLIRYRRNDGCVFL